MSILMYPGPFDRSHYSDSLSVGSNTSRQLLAPKGRQPRAEVRPQARRPPTAVPERQLAPCYGIGQQGPQPWSYNSDAYLARYPAPQGPPPPYTPTYYQPPSPPSPPPVEPPVSQLSSLLPGLLNRKSTRFLYLATVTAILLLTALVTMALYVGSGAATRPQKRAAAINSSSAGGDGKDDMGKHEKVSPAAPKRTSKLHGLTSPPRLAALNKHARKKAALMPGATQRRKRGKTTRRTTRGKTTGKRSNREVPANRALYGARVSSTSQQQTSPEATSTAEPSTATTTTRDATSLEVAEIGIGRQDDEKRGEDDDRSRTWPSSTGTPTVADDGTATRRQEALYELPPGNGPDAIWLAP